MKLPRAPKILIARGDVLGDTVVTTALIEPIMQAFPKAELYFMVQDAYIKLLSHHPKIKGFIPDPFDYADKPENKLRINPLVKTIKSHNFDVFIAVWENPRYAKCAAKAQIPVRIGHHQGWQNRYYLTHPVKTDFLDFVLHKVEVNAALLKPLGIFNGQDFPVKLFTDPEIYKALENSYPWIKTDYIMVHLDAGHPQRILKTEHFIPIVNQCLAQNKTVVLYGRSQNKEAAEQIQKALNHPANLEVIIDQVSLDQLMHFISKAKLCVGSDSGPVHIASGFSVPVLVYYFNRIQNAFHWGPWKTPHLIVKTEHPCTDVCNPTACIKTTCKDDVNLSEFEEGIVQLLSESPPNATAQRDYWAEKMLSIALFGPNKGDMAQSLAPFYHAVVIIDESVSLKEQVQELADKNCNILCYTRQSVPTLTFIKLKLLSHWVSNYVTLFPKLSCAMSHFEFEAKLRFLYPSK